MTLTGRARRLVLLLGFGGATVPLDLGVVALSLELVGPVAAAVLGWSSAVLVQAVAHYRWTFRSPGAPIRHVGGYVVGRGAGGLLRVAVVAFLVAVGVSGLAANLVGIVLATASGFVTLDWLASAGEEEGVSR